MAQATSPCIRQHNLAIIFVYPPPPTSLITPYRNPSPSLLCPFCILLPLVFPLFPSSPISTLLLSLPFEGYRVEGRGGDMDSERERRKVGDGKGHRLPPHPSTLFPSLPLSPQTDKSRKNIWVRGGEGGGGEGIGDK